MIGTLSLLPVAAAALSPRQWGMAAPPSSPGGTVTLDLATRYQTMDGFGFSEAFQRANGIIALPEPKRREVLDLLFNKTTGAGFSILRSGIGSSRTSDLDWMNTILPDDPGSPDAEPDYVWDGKDSGQLWVAKMALEYGVETFYGDAWSAPGFMKTNGIDSNGGGLCGSPGYECESGDWRQSYADYLVRYIELWESEGVDVTHIGFVNEPDLTTEYASMRMDGAQAADFIRVLRPALDAAGYPAVKITCCEATGWDNQAEYTEALAPVADLMDVITSHTYTSKITYQQPTDLTVWQSEYSDLAGRWSTDWFSSPGASGDGYTWANTLHNGLTVGNLSAYLWWCGTQDRETNNNNNEKLILVEADSYEVSKRLWAFAQYSRVVRPGAVRVEAGGAEGILTTAFENVDGSVAVVMLNEGTGNAPIRIEGAGEVYSVMAWVTDEANDMDMTIASIDEDGSVGEITVPGRGLVSVVITPMKEE